MSRVSESGGRLTFRFIDESREVREEIARALDQGIVAVSLDGPYVRRVFAGCFAGSKYGYRGSTPAAESHDASNTSRAGVIAPVAAASVGAGESASDRAIVRLVTVGRYSVMGEKRGTRAEHCDEATHVLTELEVGAFELSAAGSAGESASLGVTAGLGLGAEATSQGQSTISEGVRSACDASSAKSTQPPDACSVPLRGRLVALRRMEVDAAPPAGADHVLTLFGQYRCGHSTWQAAMWLWNVGDAVEGVVRVRTFDQPSVTGRWALVGQLDPDGVLLLHPTDPIVVPDGYEPIGFAGVLTEGGFEGGTSVSACGRFDLARVEEADSP